MQPVWKISQEIGLRLSNFLYCSVTRLSIKYKQVIATRLESHRNVRAKTLLGSYQQERMLCTKAERRPLAGTWYAAKKYREKSAGELCRGI